MTRKSADTSARTQRPPTRRSARSASAKSAPTIQGRATINDIARLAGVSKKTVSRVINRSPLVRPETLAKVSALIEQYGYVPDPQARGLAFRKSFLIGMVYDNPNAQYIVNVQYGALDALRGSGFELVVHPCNSRGADLVPSVIDFVQRQKLHGVILLPPVSEDEKLVQALRDIDCRYVRIASAHLDEFPRMVESDDRQAVVEVADHLIEQGHRRIAMVAGPSGYRSAHERKVGFIEALKRHGVKVPADFIVEGGYTFESGVICGEKLLSRKVRPTAIFACNDEMAAGVYRAAYRQGIGIPEQLSIVGFDDTPIASRLLPSLTTIRLPIRDIGRRAAAMLLIDTSAAQADVRTAEVVVPRLIVRESVHAHKG